MPPRPGFEDSPLHAHGEAKTHPNATQKAIYTSTSELNLSSFHFGQIGSDITKDSSITSVSCCNHAIPHLQMSQAAPTNPFLHAHKPVVVSQIPMLEHSVYVECTTFTSAQRFSCVHNIREFACMHLSPQQTKQVPSSTLLHNCVSARAHVFVITF
jgi:hypothetical protein